MSRQNEGGFASRGGNKLAHALAHFEIDPTGWTCADLGSNAGGFVDCLLRHGAERVYAIDTAYGLLDWSIRRNDRVVVMERTNALNVVLDEPVRLVTVDVAWTRQHLILPRAIDMLGPGGVIISLVKPHYEAHKRDLRNGVLPDELVEPTVAAVLERLESLRLPVVAKVESPIRGDGGNREILALVRGA